MLKSNHVVQNFFLLHLRYLHSKNFAESTSTKLRRIFIDFFHQIPSEILIDTQTMLIIRANRVISLLVEAFPRFLRVETSYETKSFLVEKASKLAVAEGLIVRRKSGSRWQLDFVSDRSPLADYYVQSTNECWRGNDSRLDETAYR